MLNLFVEFEEFQKLSSAVRRRGIISSWNDNPELFKGREIIVLDPDFNIERLRGEIDTFINEGSDIVNITLTDNSTLKIIKDNSEEEIQWKISKKIEIGLLERLKKLNEGEKILWKRDKAIGNYYAMKKERRRIKKGKLNQNTSIVPRNAAYVEKYVLFSNDLNDKSVISLYDNGDKETLEKIIFISNDRSQGSVKSNISQYNSISEFDINNKIIETIYIEYAVSQEKAETLIDFNDSENINKRKLVELKNIEDKAAILQSSLISREILLNNLLNNLIQNNGEFIDPSQFLEELKSDPENIDAGLSNILDLYEEELGIKIKYESLLKDLVLASNYKRFVTNKNSFKIENEIELLYESHIQCEKIKSNKVVLIVGSAGSGKSITAAYLLGAKLNQTISDYGEEIIEIVDNIDDFPKISQSFFTSETKHVVSFNVNTLPRTLNDINHLLLCCCPSFHIIKDPEYEICAAVSLNETIKSSESIAAIILTLPYQAFTIERGNLALSSLKDLIHLIPNFFEIEALIDSIYIIITKTQGQNNIKDAINNKTAEYIQECSQYLLDTSGRLDPESLSKIEINLKLWNFIKKILDKDHLHILNLQDDKTKAMLLELYFKSPAMPINKFNSNLITNEHISKLKSLIELSTDTWWKIITPLFLQDIPGRISSYYKDINNQQLEIDKYHKDISKCNNEIENSKDLIQKEENKIKEYNDGKELIKKNGLSEEKINEELKNLKLEESIHDLAIAKNGLIKELEGKEAELESKLDEENKNTNELLFQGENLSKDKENMIIELKNAQEGFFLSSLYEFPKMEPNVRIKEMAGINQNLIFSPIGKLDENKLIAGIYTGKIVHTIDLPHMYKIIEIHESDLPKLTEEDLGADSFQVYIYGEHYHFEEKPKAKSWWKNEDYLWTVTTNWSGSPDAIPWFSVINRIPNKVFNEAKILTLKSNIKTAEEASKKITNDINGKTLLIKELIILKKKNNFELSKEKEDIKKICKQSACNNIDSIIQNSMHTLEIFSYEIKKKNEEISNIEKRIQTYQQKIIGIENLIKNEEEKRKNLAVIIHFNKKNMQYIYNLSEKILSNYYQNQTSDCGGNTFTRCNFFIESYNENYENLIKTAESVLNLIKNF